MNKTIWFVRHGESEANIGLASSMPDSIPLTQKGIEQAQAVSEYFINAPSLIVVSPFLRARQTANPLIYKFALDQAVEEWNVQEFTYLNLEKCQNTTFSQRKPLVDEYWQRSDLHHRDSHEVETFADFVFRAENTIKRIKDSNHQFTAVFTHGLFMKLIYWSLINNFPKMTENSMKEFHNFNHSINIPNCSIIKVNLTESENYVSNIIMTS